MSPPSSPWASSPAASRSRPNAYGPPVAGAVQVRPPAVKEPLNRPVVLIQVASPEVGEFALYQSTIFGRPVVVVCSAGMSRSIPESRIAIVVPRPSHCGLARANWAACVSPVGRYGLIRGVLASGGVCGIGCWAPSGCGSSIGTSPSTSTASTALSRAACSAFPVGISTLR